MKPSLQGLILLLTLLVLCIPVVSATTCTVLNVTTGPAGPAGANGTSCTIGVNWTFTLAEGNPATVTNIGNLTTALLDFGIPTGATGAVGPAGPANMTAGPQGLQGIQGIPGINGTNGTSATLAVNYTFTGLPGTLANVTNIGNITDALWDITIPAGETGATGATGGTGGQILYFRGANSTDPITYEGLIPVPAGATERDETANVGGGAGQVLIDSYITDIGYPAVTEYPAGLWRFRTFHYVNNAGGNTNAVFKVYNRTSGGTETLLFTVISEDINALVVDEYLTSYVQTAPYPVALTDRIVVKVYGQSDSGSAKVLHWVYEGSNHTSHIQTTLESAPATSLSFNVIAGETLYKGQAVYISNASGSVPVVSKADNTNTAQSRVVGLIAADTASGARGIVRRAGVLTSVDSRATNANLNPLGQSWAAGDLLFATTGGGLTNVRPTSGRSVKAAYTLSGESATDTLLAYPMENPVWITAASAEDIVLRMGDSAGVNKVSFRNYTNSEVAYVLSNGTSSFGGGSTYNATYDATSTTVASNLVGWNATYNSTYDNTSTTVTNNLANWNATYNATYDALVGGSTFNSTYDNTSTTVANNLANWNATYNATYDAKAPATQYGYVTLMAGSSMIPTTNTTVMGQYETPVNKNNYIYTNFTDQGSEESQWIVDMPGDWDSTDATNGKIIFSSLWTTDTGAGTVEWDYAAKLFPDDAAIDTALAAVGDSTDTLITAGDMHVSPDSTGALITSVGTGGRTFILKVTRNSAVDSGSFTAQLLGVRIKYIRTVTG